jgi:Xylose isomerase-like TIM barrel
MEMVSRRSFGRLLAAGLPLMMATGAILPAYAQLKNERVHGVKYGVISFSFIQDMPKSGDAGRVDNLIRAMTSLGLYDLEIMPDDMTPASLGPLRPPTANGWTQWLLRAFGCTTGDDTTRTADDRRWWAETPLSHFEGVRRKFNDAGINIECFMGNDWVTDEELNRDFLIAKALGARYLGRPAGLPRIQRMARAAETHNFPIYVHNEQEKEDYLLAAMAVSPLVRINFDTGNYTGAGGSNHLAFIEAYHDRISHLHLKDRKRDGTITPLGQGDTPVKQILWLLRDKQYDIGAFIENEVGLLEHWFKGQPVTPTIASVRQFVNYMNQVL